MLSCLLLFSFLVLPAMAEDTPDWQIYKTRHFQIYYREHHSFAHETATRCEELYSSIAVKLGFVRHSDFWLWDKRVSVYIYESRDAYLKTTRSPQWSAGRADYKARSISTYADSTGFFTSLLPHEMTHFILREFVGFKAEIPLWLDEGVAQWVEEGENNAHVKNTMVMLLYAQNRLVPLAQLTTMGVKEVDATKDPIEFYSQAVSIVGFVIDSFGAEAFRKFCVQLREGRTLDDALRFTYPTSIRSMQDLESLWLDSVRQAVERRREELINHGMSR